MTGRLREQNPYIANQCRYIANRGAFPVFSNTDITFYPEAWQGFEAQLRDLEKAESFIFLEYHAIEEAQSFARLQAILAEKAPGWKCGFCMTTSAVSALSTPDLSGG